VSRLLTAFAGNRVPIRGELGYIRGASLPERLYKEDTTAMARVLLLNGPNLNLLGTREPDVYGTQTLAGIEARAAAVAAESGHELQAFQSNAEHELIERVHRAKAEGVAFVILNPGAFTHTSIALRDALLGTALPFIEVHLSNTQAREEFRRHSYFSDIAAGVILGLGAFGYEAALRAAALRLAHAG
jgi:3-dehydroquinate dehydratase-2